MIRELAEAVGRGLFAGAAGSAAITAATMIEMKIRGREQSSAPAEATQKVLGVEATSEQREQRLSNLAHWGYGTAWGAARGVLGVLGARGAVATVLHFGAVWGTALWMLPALRVAPPVPEWGGRELAIDGANHLVYVLAANAAYEALER